MRSVKRFTLEELGPRFVSQTERRKTTLRKIMKKTLSLVCLFVLIMRGSILDG